MNNSFVEVVQKASQLRWCTQPYCTTCGNREIRGELRQLAGKGGFELARMLSELRPPDIVALPNWENCIRLAFFEITLPGPQERVLESWVNYLDREIYFADVVLFYVVRSLPFGQSVGKLWIDKCISLALSTQDESLIESLLWTLGKEVDTYADLFNLAHQMKAFPKIAKALTGCLVQPIR